MKTKPRTAKSSAAKRTGARPAKRPSRPSKKSRARSAKPGADTLLTTRRSPRRGAEKAATRRPSGRRAGRTRTPRSAAGRWLAFVKQHGVVLASARGPVPSVAEAVAGQPIVGSWWAHPKGKAIFAALSELDDSADVRCFKLVDGKVTFVHRRMWPALARLASEGVLDAARVAQIQQEHMPTGEHRNVVTPFPDWVPDDVARAATALTADAARAQLGPWL